MRVLRNLPGTLKRAAQGIAPSYRTLFVLAVAAVLIHLVYLGAIRPQAELDIEAARLAGQAAPRTLAVILKDVEQEICLVLMVCCIYQIFSRSRELGSRRYLFQVDFLSPGGDAAPAPDAEAGSGSEAGNEARIRSSLRRSLDELEALPEEIAATPLVDTLKAGLRRYLVTGDVQNTSDAVSTGIDALNTRFEADNAMIRYIIWAIPSIGFVGTVRGIGQALASADKALAGDIATMTENLGIAFNSTMVALVISILLMLLLHGLQQRQDRWLVDIQDYCERLLLNRISR